MELPGLFTGHMQTPQGQNKRKFIFVCSVEYGGNAEISEASAPQKEGTGEKSPHLLCQPQRTSALIGQTLLHLS